MLLTQADAAVPALSGNELIHEHYAPLGLLLPRALALIHHGGIGSSAQALRAGVPQLVMPQAVDQFENAMRLCALGVARSLLPERLGAERMREMLHDLLADARVGGACVHARSRFGNSDPMWPVRRLIESFA